jgi:hypothetical protein
LGLVHDQVLSHGDIQRIQFEGSERTSHLHITDVFSAIYGPFNQTFYMQHLLRVFYFNTIALQVRELLGLLLLQELLIIILDRDFLAKHTILFPVQIVVLFLFGEQQF